ncbi:Uncharacterized conserved protein, DUF952 family [Mesorhizobium albiziae]|uniref:Uncharacterized conserved protein, DUF952 family n=1 Tax=Neomesorhizobium albiziae TaxID=335020 RepID=A0A1I4CK23_9HYPH|nr:DUF952 domain-containing protein [Mesorhizobium albiziae]GLS29259.1 dihydroorotate dehydrogenase [Mesorhizobium albiziae]SFK80647.1 Uncharacterized conserved protein, DUF952 family [Mesorhizobium albiziae]
MHSTIYKIVTETAWREAEKAGVFTGAPIDVSDGYIHFSTAGQAKETAAKHFAGQTGLLLVAIDAEKLGGALKYEPSRGGALFPHLYAPLDMAAVRWVKPLPLNAAGDHQFPVMEA